MYYFEFYDFWGFQLDKFSDIQFSCFDFLNLNLDVFNFQV